MVRDKVSLIVQSIDIAMSMTFSSFTLRHQRLRSDGTATPLMANLRKAQQILALAACLLLSPLGMVNAQTNASSNAPKSRPAAAIKPVPASANLSFNPQRTPEAKEYSLASRPSWVVEPPPAAMPLKTLPPGQSRRYVLMDEQWRVSEQTTAMYFRLQMMAMAQGALKEASEPQFSFNPEYQKLIIHSAAVIRDGQRTDRLAQARLEVLRREQQLERQMIDGYKTVLMIVPDVRVGDIVDVAYSVEGRNPIFEDKFTTHLNFAQDAWVDQLHQRIDMPASRPLYFNKFYTQAELQMSMQGDRRIYSIQLANITPVVAETQTPPWYKVYPGVQVTEYADWQAVDRWAQRLFEHKADDPAILQLVESIKARKLSPQDTVAAALHFVQDEIRYFSVSLGVSSHLPKVPAKTLQERLGDCKDKVALFNALMRGLGFDSQPVLVSMFRNRAVLNYLPSPQEFDHVIAKVRVEGQDYYVDPTISQQGESLSARGYYPYGAGLVIGAQQAPQPITLPSFAKDRIEFMQEWDFSDLKRSSWPLKLTMKAEGRAAERWRDLASQGVLERWTQALGGAYVKVYNGIRSAGNPEIKDDRALNTWQMSLSFDYSGPIRYSRGAIEHESTPLELMDYLITPPEARRSMPYQLDMPAQIEYKVSVKGVRPFTLSPPPARQFGDKHFGGNMRTEIKAETVITTIRIDRRHDEVLPADVLTYRERISEARRLVGQSVRMAIIDTQALKPRYEEIDKRLASLRRGGSDQLLDLVIGDEVKNLFAEEAFKIMDVNNALAAQVYIDRGTSRNQLAQFSAALSDADAALKIDASLSEAHEIRGVALMGLGRYTEAIAAFTAAGQAGASTVPDSWIGIANYYAGNLEQAQNLLVDLARNASGMSKEFVNIWLIVVSEHRKPGSSAHLISSDDLQKNERLGFSREILRYMAGQIDQEALIKSAKTAKPMERLNLAEAYFFIGQKHSAQGKREEAKTWFQKTIEVQALPYREHSLAMLEIKR